MSKQQVNNVQRVDLYQPMLATSSQPPLVLRTVIPSQNSISEGVPSSGHRSEAYVLLSALPEEIRRRVELAIQMLLSAR